MQAYSSFAPRPQVEDPTAVPKPVSYVMFTIQDQLSRVAQWLEKSFLCGRKVAGDRCERRQGGWVPEIAKALSRPGERGGGRSLGL